MSVETVKMKKYTCDGCGEAKLFPVDYQLPDIDGYHGNGVTLVSASGGRGTNHWYACQSSCIEEAVNNAVHRDS